MVDDFGFKYSEDELRELALEVAKRELPRMREVDGFDEMTEDERLRCAIAGAFVIGMRSGLESARRAVSVAGVVPAVTSRHSRAMRMHRMRRPR